MQKSLNDVHTHDVEANQSLKTAPASGDTTSERIYPEKESGTDGYSIRPRRQFGMDTP